MLWMVSRDVHYWQRLLLVAFLRQRQLLARKPVTGTATHASWTCGTDPGPRNLGNSVFPRTFAGVNMRLNAAVRDALKIEWDDGPNQTYNSPDYENQLRATARRPGKVVRNDGDAEKAFAEAVSRIEAEYYIPHMAQSPMEPPAATARIVNGKCEVWACVQAPQATRSEVASRLGVSTSDVTVHVTLLGGGFGRKSKPDFAVEAAVLSRQMGGAPVKVTLTREDDIRHGYYH